MSFSLRVAQLNPVVGNIQGNLDKAVRAAQFAAESGERVIVFSELFLSGYAAEDLYFHPQFVLENQVALKKLQQVSHAWPNLYVVIGCLLASQDEACFANTYEDSAQARLANAACIIHCGKTVLTSQKSILPNQGVFDEKRYFKTQVAPVQVLEIDGVKLALLICEDIWQPEPAQAAKEAGAELLLVLNASPYAQGKPAQRHKVVAKRIHETNLPIIYANCVGGQDDLVFDGSSFAMNENGQCVGQAHAFIEQSWSVQIKVQAGKVTLHGSIASICDQHTLAWRAMVLATKDYVEKNGFTSVVLGLSGGLDSALVLAIAVDALGADKVHAVMLPSIYTSEISFVDARDICQRLAVSYEEIDIGGSFTAIQESLQPLFAGRQPDITEENIQARIRGLVLMAISNKFGHLLLTTGNKSEVAMGYSTLYGDMCGGFAPIKDVYKSEAFALACWRNQNTPEGGIANPIPERIITRPPSAELRENQTDQDSLPPYDMLDGILRLRMEEELSAKEIVARGFPQDCVEQVLRLLRINEYKRRQAAVGPKLTSRHFGKDWRYPITNQY